MLITRLPHPRRASRKTEDTAQTRAKLIFRRGRDGLEPKNVGSGYMTPAAISSSWA